MLLLVPIVLIVGLVSVAVVANKVVRSRKQLGSCPACDYPSVSDNPDALCSECGLSRKCAMDTIRERYVWLSVPFASVLLVVIVFVTCAPASRLLYPEAMSFAAIGPLVFVLAILACTQVSALPRLRQVCAIVLALSMGTVAAACMIHQAFPSPPAPGGQTYASELSASLTPWVCAIGELTAAGVTLSLIALAWRLFDKRTNWNLPPEPSHSYTSNPQYP